MRLLVTRPEQDAAPLIAALAALGHQAVSVPLLRIVYAPAPPDLDLDAIGALAFTSANGVRAFAQASTRRDWPVFAVGAATAAEARAQGFGEVHAAAGDVASLGALIGAGWSTAAGLVLHVSGHDVRGDLVADLTARGLRARRCALYEAQARPLAPIARKALAEGTLNGALFYSPRTARLFGAQLAEADLTASVTRLDAFCLSPAVAEALRPLRWRRVVVAARPEQAALLASLAPGR